MFLLLFAPISFSLKGWASKLSQLEFSESDRKKKRKTKNKIEAKHKHFCGQMLPFTLCVSFSGTHRLSRALLIFVVSLPGYPG